MSTPDQTAPPEAAEAQGDYYCPGCGTRYDTPGICTGPPESGHEPLNVASVADAEATTADHGATVEDVFVPEPDALAPPPAAAPAEFDPVKAGVPTNAQFAALLARVGPLETAANTTLPGAISVLSDRVAALEAELAAAKADPPPPLTPVQPDPPAPADPPAADPPPPPPAAPAGGWPA